MINLLPLKNKSDIKKEYLRRVFVVFGFLVSFMIFSGIILLIPLNYFLGKLKLDNEKNLVFYKERADFEETQKTKKIISDLNNKIKIFKKHQNEFHELNSVIEKIISYAPAGIKIDDFFYDRRADEKGNMIETITVGGIGATRNDVVIFMENLNRNGVFKDVRSPVSNLLKSKDINFTITIDLYAENR